MIESPLLASLGGVRHAHSVRADGPFGPKGKGDVEARRAAFVRDSLRAAHGVIPEQVHGAAVHVAAAADRGRGFGAAAAIARTDALVTGVSGLALLVQGADCPLLALVDPEARVVGAVHSGWRGTVLRIADRAVASMEECGARAGRTRAAVFPGIGPCCFEVGPEVRDEFVAAFGGRARPWFRDGSAGTDRSHLDLHAAIVATLEDAGLDRARIDVVPGCTACDGRFFSHRASRGGTGRHALGISLAG